MFVESWNRNFSTYICDWGLASDFFLFLVMLPVIALILTHSGSCSSHGLGLQQKAQKQLERTSKIKIKIPKLNVELQKIFVEFQKKKLSNLSPKSDSRSFFRLSCNRISKSNFAENISKLRKGDVKGEKKKNEQFLEQSKKRN